MPFLSIVLGAVLIDLSVRGTEHEFARQAGRDFGAGTRYWAWVAAIAILGSIGFYAPARHLSNMAMALVVIVLVLTHGGLFARAARIISHPPIGAPSVPLPGSGASGSSSGGGIGGTGVTAGQVIQLGITAAAGG